MNTDRVEREFVIAPFLSLKFEKEFESLPAAWTDPAFESSEGASAVLNQRIIELEAEIKKLTNENTKLLAELEAIKSGRRPERPRRTPIPPGI